MTPAAQTLCRDIAEAEGEQVSEDGKYVIHSEREDGRRWKDSPFLLELYLTDPGETVRMLEELFEGGLIAGKQNGAYHVLKPGLYKPCSIPITDLAHAVAEAYLAMLLAKQGEKI